MTRRLKPVELELDEKIQKAVLEIPVRMLDQNLTTVGLLIKTASDALEVANRAIQDNALIQLTASHLMKQEKRRGTPNIQARLDGSVVLLVSYYEDEEPPSLPTESIQPSNHVSKKLPSLEELRKRAQEMGVDVSDLGRQKINILRRLEEVELQRSSE